MPRLTLPAAALLMTLSGCSVTATPENVPILGPMVSGCLQELSPFEHLDLAGLVQVEMKGAAGAEP